jgi:hypothetical protein
MFFTFYGAEEKQVLRKLAEAIGYHSVYCLFVWRALRGMDLGVFE